LGSFTAGLVGALTGLGGGVVIVPLLTSVFGVDIRYAVGASLVSVIATSLGSASTYIKKGYANLRLGMFLEVATTIGALIGAFIATHVIIPYQVRALPAGFSIMLVAGVLSGLLGIGSGAFKVLAMDQAMGLPFKVSTTTSNFMIGVTAAASSGVYLTQGYIDPGLSMPVMLGVLPGAFLGARILIGAKTQILRIIFSFVLVVMAFKMVYNSLIGGL